jgi:hypothetical protein
MDKTWLTQKSSLTTTDDLDVMHVVDVDDFSETPEGTSKTIDIASMKSNLINPNIVFASQSTLTNQIPSVLNTAETVDLGPDSSNSLIDLTSSEITILSGGVYSLSITTRIARGASAGVESLGFQSLVNGVAVPVIPFFEFSATDQDDFFTFMFSSNPVSFATNDTVRLEMATTVAAGGLDIGLYSKTTSVVGWNNAPTASLIIVKFL